MPKAGTANAGGQGGACAALAYQVHMRVAVRLAHRALPRVTGMVHLHNIWNDGVSLKELFFPNRRVAVSGVGLCRANELSQVICFWPWNFLLKFSFAQ